MIVQDLIIVSTGGNITEEPDAYVFSTGWACDSSYIIFEANMAEVLHFAARTSGAFYTSFNFFISEADTAEMNNEIEIFHETFPGADNQTIDYKRQVTLSKKYLRFLSSPIQGGWPDFECPWPGRILKKPIPDFYISGKVTTPQGHPVFNASVKSTIDSKKTDIDGTYSGLGVLTGANKLWAEKSINKSLLGKTAKEISLLKDINVDT